MAGVFRHAAMIVGFCKWLAQTPASQFIQTVRWIIPAVQSIHILCVAIVMTSVLMVNLRMLRLIGRDVSIAGMERRFLPPVWVALAVLLATGAILTVGEPARELMNDVFRLKMLMLLLVVGITLIFWRRTALDPHYWESTRGRRVAGRWLALVSIVLWCAILTAGRWIAYTTEG